MQQNLGVFADILRDLGVDILLANHAVLPPVSLASSDEQLVSLDVEIQSWDGLNVLVDAFEVYEPHRRPGTATHFLMVTDDDTRPFESSPLNPNPPRVLAPDELVTQLTGLLGMPFVYHSIASPGEADAPCEGAHGVATRRGLIQLEVAERTGGSQQDICAPDWAPLFQYLAGSLLEDLPLSCDFALPPLPSGTSSAPQSVDIQLATMGDATVYTVPASDNAESCGPMGGGTSTTQASRASSTCARTPAISWVHPDCRPSKCLWTARSSSPLPHRPSRAEGWGAVWVRVVEIRATILAQTGDFSVARAHVFPFRAAVRDGRPRDANRL